MATSCLATRIINQWGIVVNGRIAPFKTDPTDQNMNSNRVKRTLLLICQSGFPPNPWRKRRIRSAEARFGFVVFRTTTYRVCSHLTSLFIYFIFCTQARSHSQLHTAAAVFPHPTPSYKLNYVTEERKEKKKREGGGGRERRGLHKRDIHNLFAQTNYGL